MALLRGLYQRLCGGQDLAGFHITIVRTMLLQVGLLAMTTVATILVSRQLGLEGRGTASWLMNFAFVGFTCAALGMGNASKKYVAKMPELVPACAVLNLLLLGVSLCFFLPVFYAYGGDYPVPQHDRHAFIAALCLIPGLALSSISAEMMIGAGRFLHINVLMAVEKVLHVALSAALLLSGLVSPVNVIIIYGLCVLARIVLSAYYLAPHLRTLPTRHELRHAFRMMRKLLLSAYVSSIASYYSTFFLTLTLGVVSSVRELGYFAVVKLLVDNVMNLVWSLHSFAIPQLARQRSEESYQKTKWHIVMLISVVMVAGVLPLYLFSDWIMLFLFGEEFAEAGRVLHIIAPGIVAAGIGAVLNAIIATQPKEYLYMLSPLCTAACMTVLVVYFRDSLDSVRAAYIYNSAYIIGMLVALLPVARARLEYTTHKAKSAV